MRLLELIKILRKAGFDITYLAFNSNVDKYRHTLKEIGVECISDIGMAVSGSVDVFGGFLNESQFQVAIMETYTSHRRYAPYLRAMLPGCRIVLDTTDLASVRCEREAQLRGDAKSRSDAEEVKAAEKAALEGCDSVWMVTETERQIVLDRLPGKDVHVVPNIHRVEHDLPGYGDNQMHRLFQNA